MNKTSLRLAFVVLLSSTVAARALDVPDGGRDLTAGRTARSYVESGRGTAGPLPDGGLFLDVTNAASAKGYAMQYAIGLTEGIAKKQRVLAIVRARVTGSDTGRATAKVQMSTSPWTDIGGDAEIELFREWRDYPVLFVATENLPAGKAEFVLHVARQRQRIEIASVRVLAYPETMDTALFPRIRRSYAGREADAPWRKEALERIERERKKNLKVTLRGADGDLARNLPVKLTLRRHAFGFGSAVPVKWLLDETEDGRKYREIVDDYFSLIVFENDLKDFDWRTDYTPERRAARNERLDRAFAWLQARNIAVRGHYLMQVATPHNLHKASNDFIRVHYLDGTRERLACVQDRVVEWDVINHPIAWDGADMLTARPDLAKIDREVFDLARSLSKLPMYVNEDQLFRPGRQSDDTFAYVKKLVEDGYPVAGIGNQAHIHESYLPSPAEVLRVTDRFATIVPRQVITEYDICTTADEDLAADYTRDLLIACFSHQAYSGFLWWGFWEGSHWKPEAASWNKDWTPRKRSEVFRDWIMGRWKTEVSLMTDDNGVASWRGFPGWYEVRSGEQSLPTVEAK